MSTRVYLPLVLSDLAEVAAAREVPLRATVHGVTLADRQAQEHADEEELEFDAMCAALDAADALRRTKGERRVVVAADVPTAQDAGALAVVLPAPAPLRSVVSYHVEESPGTPAGEGYDDLLWYDRAELDELVEGSSG